MRLNVQYLGFFFTVLVLLFAIPSSQASAEDVSRSEQQASHGIPSDDAVVCEEGLEKVWENDGTPICVEPENVLKLVKSGWIPPQTVDKISILDKKAHETSENVYAFQFDYCAAVYNEETVGIIISSHIEKIPIPIDLNIQIDQCHRYGTQIHALSDSSLAVSLFYEKDIQTLFKNFEKKKMNLKKTILIPNETLPCFPAS